MAALALHTTIEKRGPAAAIVLADAQVAALGGSRTAPVTVTIGEVTLRLRLARMGGENLIGLSKQARADLGVDAGDEVEVVIAVDTAERTVEIPPALAVAFADDPSAGAAFAGLSYTRRKEIAALVTGAKQEATRQRRLAAILAELGAR